MTLSPCRGDAEEVESFNDVDVSGCFLSNGISLRRCRTFPKCSCCPLIEEDCTLMCCCRAMSVKTAVKNVFNAVAPKWCGSSKPYRCQGAGPCYLNMWLEEAIKKNENVEALRGPFRASVSFAARCHGVGSSGGS